MATISKITDDLIFVEFELKNSLFNDEINKILMMAILHLKQMKVKILFY